MDTSNNRNYDFKFFFPSQKNNSGLDQDVKKGHAISGLENTQSSTRQDHEQACSEPTLNISWEGI